MICRAAQRARRRRLGNRRLVAADHPLVRFMSTREWLIDIDEFARDPELYGDLVLPDWLERMPRAWLIVPLIVHDHMVGFMVLANSPAQTHFNWEDSDLVITSYSIHYTKLYEYNATGSIPVLQDLLTDQSTQPICFRRKGQFHNTKDPGQ